MSAGSAAVPLTEVPALAPPAGVTPNFNNPYSILNSLIAGDTLCLTLATISITIRLYTKFFLLKTHGLDDYTMFAAWVVLVAYCGLQYKTSKYGSGVHQWDVPATNLVHWAQWGYVIWLVYPPAIILTKLSICLQYIQIFVVGHDKAFWCIQAFVWVNILYYVICFFIIAFQCVPVAKIWDPERPGHCVNYSVYNVISGVFNSVSDILMLLFPLVRIWTLQMSIERKKGVTAIFLIGLLALVASLLRLAFSVVDNGSHDQTFQLSRVAVCTTGEIAAGIVVGNLVVSPRFFRTYSTKVTSFFSNLRSGRSSGLSHHASPSKTSSSSPKTSKSQRSASWLDQHSGTTKPSHYFELSDQATV